MYKYIVLVLLVVISSTAQARYWSGYGSITQLKIYEGSVISFYIQNNTVQTSPCQTNNTHFFLDLDNAVKPNYLLSILLSAQATGSEVRVLPTNDTLCLNGGAKILSIDFK